MSNQSEEGRSFCYVVDGVQYESSHPRITAGEIMDSAGIPREVGLIEISEDGTLRNVGADETFNLAQHFGKFKRCPSFNRG